MKQLNLEVTEKLIEEFLDEIILQPRKNILKWSNLTKQTPNIKVGYPAQHLVSLVTGIEGTRSGARGEDVSDSSEIKSCNRVDQVDTCKSCKEKVLRNEEKCSHCESSDIVRKNDSKWLFTIRSEKELEKLINSERIILTLFDYPNFTSNDFDKIRIRIFEIYPKKERHRKFVEIMTQYFYDIYQKNIDKNPNQVPAPKNFWPEQYQFYLSNPIKVFECHISSINNDPTIDFIEYVKPSINRDELSPEPMPKKLLNKKEIGLFDHDLGDYLNESEAKLLSIR
jgi:hypothetical protein